jgi:tryptophan halogenase
MKVVIIGGGTAGWLTACYFQSYSKLYEKNMLPDFKYDITVVESPTVPIIGAGEGSTGIFPDAIAKFGNIDINEIDFLYETESTLKLGIRFKDWNGIGTSYMSPIGPTQTHTGNIDIELFTYALKNKVSDSALSGYLANRGMSTFRKNMFQQIPIHGYHFDAHKVGQYLKSKCILHGTKHIVNHIVNISKDGSNIKNIILQSGEIIEGDLFIDCSGFSRVLIKQMDMGWESYTDYLPVNAALPYLHQYTDNEQIMPETLAWAQNNGWMWQIPTQQRYGCGYVYCDAFVNQDTALNELQKTTNRKIEPIRNLKFEVGRVKTFWKHNVVAIGLSSAFLEPLQATSIHTTLIQIQMLMNYIHPKEKQTAQVTVEQYNKYILQLIDEFKDLIQIQYMTKREDSDFWKFVKYDMKKTEKTKFVLETTKHRSLGFFDFDTMPHGSAGWAVWGWTLVGLDIMSKDIIFKTINKQGLKINSFDLNNALDETARGMQKQAGTLLTNTEFINLLREKKFNSSNFNKMTDVSFMGYNTVKNMFNQIQLKTV